MDNAYHASDTQTTATLHSSKAYEREKIASKSGVAQTAPAPLLTGLKLLNAHWFNLIPSLSNPQISPIFHAASDKNLGVGKAGYEATLVTIIVPMDTKSRNKVPNMEILLHAATHQLTRMHCLLIMCTCSIIDHV